MGFSLVVAWALWSWDEGSAAVAQELSCPMADGILVPQPGLKPTSLVLEGGFLTTGPPGVDS